MNPSSSQASSSGDGHQAMLRWALTANALFSGLTALISLSAAARVAEFVGLPEAEVFSLGLNLAFFAAVVGFLAFQRDYSKKWVQVAVWVVITMDILWVVGSAALLLTPDTPLTTAGRWAVFLVAAAVADFALFQFLGWRRVRSALAS